VNADTNRPGDRGPCVPGSGRCDGGKRTQAADRRAEGPAGRDPRPPAWVSARCYGEHRGGLTGGSGGRPPGTALSPWASTIGALAGMPRWLALLLGALAWAAALAGIEPIVHGYLTSFPDQRMVDLAVYRLGGLSVLRGQPLYSVITQPPQMLPFTYPPLAAVFAVPLAMMPWPADQVVWLAFIYVPLAIVVAYAFRPLLARAGRFSPVVFAGLFCVCAYLFPMQDEIRFGQVDALLAAMFVADCAAARPRWPRGALVGLATAIKLMPGVFIIYLWASGRRRAARTAVLAAAAWTAGAFLVLPADSVTYWTGVIFDPGRLGDNAGTENQSLRGLLLRFFLPGHAPAVLWAVIAVAVAVAGFTLARRLSLDRCEMAGVAVTALLEVLLSPVSWIHDFMVVVIVIGVLAGDGRLARRVVTAAGTTALFMVTIPWMGSSLMSADGVPQPLGRIVQGGFGIAAAVLVVVIARMRRTDADRSWQENGPSGPGRHGAPPGEASTVPDGGSAPAGIMKA
jgi:alpha-1,2-mannosyltransferase